MGFGFDAPRSTGGAGSHPFEAIARELKASAACSIDEAVVRGFAPNWEIGLEAVVKLRPILVIAPRSA